MYRYALFIFLSLALLAGCSGGEKQSASPGNGKPSSGANAAQPLTVGDFQLHSPIHTGSVSIIPVSMNKEMPTQDGNFMTLSEAKKEGLVVITELGEGDVNALRVENKGTRPLLLLGGDLLLGGKQDRIVAKDTIVPPGKTMNVDVYCVEHGRWDGQSEHFEYKEAVVPTEVRDAAAYGDQQQVWAKVDSFNSINGAGEKGLTVMGGYSAPKVQKAVTDDVPKILDALKGMKNVVGFIYVQNGEIKSADMFGSPRILDAAKESLLKGYLADGASQIARADAKVDMGAVGKFMEEVIDGRKARARNQMNGRPLKYEGKATRGIELSGDGSVNASAPIDASGFVHGTYSPSKK